MLPRSCNVERGPLDRRCPAGGEQVSDFSKPGGIILQAPAARWEKATPEERAVPDPALLREAFLWSERRKADKTALVRLHGNVYQVDAWLAGRVVELLFDPFDLDRIEVRLGGKPAGTAVPFVMGRHRHPKTRTPDGQARTEPAPTGIDYLGALGDSHDEALREQVSYQFLVSGHGDVLPGSRPEARRRNRLHGTGPGMDQ